MSQIPALIVSTAAGLLVAKAGVAERTDNALFGQLSAHPRALGTTSGLLALLAVLPGHADAAVPAAVGRQRRRSPGTSAGAPAAQAAPAEEQARRGAGAGRGADQHARSRWTRSGSSSATACCR